MGLRACEARALHTRGSRLRRSAPSENVQKRLFCSLGTQCTLLAMSHAPLFVIFGLQCHCTGQECQI